ncbi:MAG: serine/threonine-protein kinase [Micromonosporaceae bacterium]
MRLVAERYRLVKALGSGGMGRVWLARDEVLRRDVAVKEVIFPIDTTTDERDELVERTMREARAAGRLSHPNVVRVYDVVEAEGRPWIVMEYLPSRSLYQLIKRRGPLPPREVAKIGVGVLAALTAAHRAGVLHRDVKPGNVLITEDGRVVLTDFGLATFEGGDGAVTRSGLSLGSAQYRAPARARDGASSVAADLWSLGATLYAAVEGRSPYARPTSMATLTALATAPPDPPQRAGPLKPVLTGLLRKNPRARLSAVQADRLLRRVATRPGRGRDADEVGPEPVDLTESGPADPVVDGMADPTVGVPVSPAPRVMPRIATPELLSLVDKRRRRWPWLVAAALVLVLGPGLAIALQRDPPSGGRAGPDPTAPATLPATARAVAGAQACTGQRADQETLVPNQVPLLRGERALPGAWVWWRDPTGLRIAAQPGWGVSRIGSLLCFRERDGTRVVAVTPVESVGPDLTGDWDQREPTWLAAANLTNYTRYHLATEDYLLGAADLEYGYDSADGVRMHGITRLVRIAPDRVYLIYWLAKDQDWASYTPLYQLVFVSLNQT